MCLMKKILYFVAITAVVLLTATSCDKEDNPAPVDPSTVVKIEQISITTTDGAIVAEVNMKAGETIQLKTAVTPVMETLPTLDWNTDNEGVATVSPEGVLTAVGEGVCTITVEAVETPGVKASLQVTVTVDKPGDEPVVGETVPINDNAVDQSKAEVRRR